MSMGMNSWWLLMGLGLWVVGTTLAAVFVKNSTPFDFGIILQVVGWLSTAWATMDYAASKGRSKSWFLIGVLGFIVVFFLPPSEIGEEEIEVQKHTTATTWLLGAVLAFGLFSISWTNIHNGVYGVYVYDFLFPSQYIISLFAAALLPLTALILNLRKMSVIAGWILAIIFFFLLFYIQARDTALVADVYKEARNFMYFFMVVYAILHSVIHGGIILLRKNRDLYTFEGLFSFYALLLFTTYSYALYEFILKLGF